MGARRRAKQAQRDAAKARWAAKSPEEKRRTTTIWVVVIGVVIGGSALINALAEDPSKPTKAGLTEATEVSASGGLSSAAKFYKDRACEDFSELRQGIADRTMSMADIVAKLGKMAKNTKDLASVDPSFESWNTAVRRLKVDFEESSADASVASDTAEVAVECP